MRKPVITKYCRIDSKKSDENEFEKKLESRFEKYIESKIEKFIKDFDTTSSKNIIIIGEDDEDI